MVLSAPHPAAICRLGRRVQSRGSTRWSSGAPPLRGSPPTPRPRASQRWPGHCCALFGRWHFGGGCDCGQSSASTGSSPCCQHRIDFKFDKMWASGCRGRWHRCFALPFPWQLASWHRRGQQGAAQFRVFGSSHWGWYFCPYPHCWTGRQSRRSFGFLGWDGGSTGRFTAPPSLCRICSHASQHALQSRRRADHGLRHVWRHASAEFWGLYRFAPYGWTMDAGVAGVGSWGPGAPLHLQARPCSFPGVVGVDFDICCRIGRRLLCGWSKSMPRRLCCALLPSTPTSRQVKPSR